MITEKAREANKQAEDSRSTQETKIKMILTKDNATEQINCNKPWRCVIKRNVLDGGGYDENIY